MKLRKMHKMMGAQIMRPFLSSFAVVASVACMTVRADVVRYEYMTIAGSNTTDGVRVLTDYVPKSNTVVRDRKSVV